MRSDIQLKDRRNHLYVPIPMDSGDNHKVRLTRLAVYVSLDAQLSVHSVHVTGT